MRFAPLLCMTVLACSGSDDAAPMPPGDDDAGRGADAGERTEPPPEPTDRGTSKGAQVTQTIGPSGGTLTSGDGVLSIEFPPGALSEDTEIGIEPITNEAPLGQGDAYRLTPDGATFAQPVRLVFNYTAADHIGSSQQALALAFQDEDRLWRYFGVPELDEANGTVSAETTHFTDVSRVLGWQLVPFDAEVSAGGTLELELRWCEPERLSDPDGGDDLSGLFSRCGPDEDVELPRLVTVNGWAVNGNDGGSLGDGAISGQGKRATYTAPLAPPMQNPVAVSCEFNRRRGTNLAVANVLIGPGGWQGEIRWTLMGEQMEASGGITTAWSANGEGVIDVRPGPAGRGEVASASASYGYTEVETTGDSYIQTCCNISYTQARTQTLDGTATIGASVIITPAGEGASIIVGLPAGETSGLFVTHAEETRSPAEACGEGGCISPAPTHIETPITGAMPNHVLTFDAIGSSGQLQGMTTIRVDGRPPIDYAVTYDLVQ